jgi:hypothetical protein
MRQGTFGRSWDTFDKALVAASKLAKQTGFRIPIFRLKKDVCSDADAYVVLFPAKAEHLLTIGPGADVKIGDDETPPRDEPVQG